MGRDCGTSRKLTILLMKGVPVHGVVRTSGIPREKAAQRKINTLEWATVAAEVGQVKLPEAAPAGRGIKRVLTCMTNLLTSHARIPAIMTIRTSDASLEGESDKTSAKSETRPALGHQSPRHVASRTPFGPRCPPLSTNSRCRTSGTGPPGAPMPKLVVGQGELVGQVPTALKSAKTPRFQRSR